MELKIGDKLYLTCTKYVTITKVGRKWYTTDSRRVGRVEKFTLEAEPDYRGMRTQLYSDLEYLKELTKRSQLRSVIRRAFHGVDSIVDELTDSELEEIYTIIKRVRN